MDFIFNQIIQINILEELVYHLLNEIGLEINSNGFVYDLDTGQELYYNGKQIRASINPMFPALANDLYGLFDPVFDGKFMSMMLGYYLKKSEAQEIIHPISMTDQIAETPIWNNLNPVKTRKTRVVVLCEGHKEYYSEYYYQKGLKFSDMILRLGGHPVNLWKFDSIPEEPIQIIHTQIPTKNFENTRNINFGGTARENIINAEKQYNNKKNWSGECDINYWDD